MSKLLTLQQVADRLGLTETPRAVYSLPIKRTALSKRRTRWAEDDVEAYKVECRSTTITTRSDGATVSIESLKAAASDLQSWFT